MIPITPTRVTLLIALIGPALVSFGFVLAQPLNLGVRYVMPTFALLLERSGGTSMICPSRVPMSCAIPRPLTIRMSVATIGWTRKYATSAPSARWIAVPA